MTSTLSADLGFASTRSMNLDSTWSLNLDDLPVIEEYIPVEDFWPEYMEQLEFQGQNAEDTTMVAGTEGPELLPPVNGLAPGVAAPEALETTQPMALELPVPPTLLDPANQLGQSTANISSPAQSATMPAIPTHSQRGRTRTNHRQSSSKVDAQDSGSDHGLHTTDSKMKRNAKQQLQNKQAQARYRDRRKQRFAEMEQTIDLLQDQVKDVQQVRDQNAQLQGQASQLQKMLHEKEAEIERLRVELEGKDSGYGSGGAGDNFGKANRVQEDPAAVERARGECRREYEQHIQTVREHIEQNNLRSVNQLGEGVSADVLKRTGELVLKGCCACQRATRAGGIDLAKVMSNNLGQMTHIDCSQQRTRWLRILEVLRLTPEQQEQMLLLRKQHLGKLRTIFEDRQARNMEAIRLMLPNPTKASAASNTSLEGKMSCMTMNGYLYCSRNNAQLDTVLDNIKDNLRQEQKTVAEMNYITMQRILSPVQAALFLVEAYPQQVDCLALANICALQLGRDAVPPSTDDCGKMLASVAADARVMAKATANGSDHHSGHSDKSEGCFVSATSSA